MSFQTCLKVGTATGLVGGMAFSAYFTGAAERANKNDNAGTFAIGMFSFASLIGGPFIGAGAGLSYYGANRSVKYLRTKSLSTQLTALTIISSAIAIKGAYTLAKTDK